MPVLSKRFAANLLALFLATSLGTATLVASSPSTTYADPGSDPLLDQQWGLTAIGAPSVWSITRGAGVTVAVIDSGSGPHPDLDANMEVGRTIFGSIDSAGMSDVDADKGHGTHVAGIIAAAADNGIGGAGVAPQVRILPIRALDSLGSGDSKDVSKSVRFAVDSGAKVINLSLGGELESPSLTSAIQYAVDRNVLVVAAAGNGTASAAPKWPAASDLTLAVTAVDRTTMSLHLTNEATTSTLPHQVHQSFRPLEMIMHFKAAPAWLRHLSPVPQRYCLQLNLQ